MATTNLCTFTGGVAGSYEANIAQNGIGDFKITVPERIGDAVALMMANHAALPAAAAVAPPPVADALGWKALFRMKLQASSQLIVGTLSLTDGNGAVAIEVSATSGVHGHQDKSNLWEVKHGPVPPNPKVSVGNAIETLERSTPAISREFRIRPESVTQPAPPHVTRGEFRVHHEHGTHGSEGCIALINEADFERFAEIMHTLHNHGTESIALAIRYS